MKKIILMTVLALSSVSATSISAATLNINKQADVNGEVKPQANAKFVVTKMAKQDGKVVVDNAQPFQKQVETNTQGLIVLKDLHQGTYQIKELAHDKTVLMYIKENQTLTYMPKTDLAKAEDLTDNQHGSDVDQAGVDNKDTSVGNVKQAANDKAAGSNNKTTSKQVGTKTSAAVQGDKILQTSGEINVIKAMMVVVLGMIGASLALFKKVRD